MELSEGCEDDVGVAEALVADEADEGEDKLDKDVGLGLLVPSSDATLDSNWNLAFRTDKLLSSLATLCALSLLVLCVLADESDLVSVSFTGGSLRTTAWICAMRLFWG